MPFTFPSPLSLCIVHDSFFVFIRFHDSRFSICPVHNLKDCCGDDGSNLNWELEGCGFEVSIISRRNMEGGGWLHVPMRERENVYILREDEEMICSANCN